MFSWSDQDRQNRPSVPASSSGAAGGPSSSSTSSSSSSSASPSSWTASKESGKHAFNEGDYPKALMHYFAALEKLGRGGDVAGATANANNAAGSNSGGRSSGGGANGAERQILLSNMVACRLKIGGEEMAKAAVEEAKECVAVNDRWAKAHVRLASAYIALGDHSNDACVSLQRALALDRGNATARSMLVNELRRRDRPGSGGGGGGGSASTSTATGTEGGTGEGEAATAATPESERGSEGGERTTEATPSAPPEENFVGGDNDRRRRADGVQGNGGDPYADVDVGIDDVDDTVPLSQRLSFRFARLAAAHENLSDDLKTIIKVFVCLLVMYVAFGGRFGLDSMLGGGGDVRTGARRESYRGDAGSAYSDRQHRRTSTASSSSSSSFGSGYNDRTNPDNARQYDRYGSDSRYEGEGRYSTHHNRDYNSADNGRDNRNNHRQQQPYGRETRSGEYNRRDDSRNQRSSYGRENYNDDYSHGSSTPRRSTSYHMPNLFDGSMVSMAVLLVVGAVCHHFGLNPFQLIMMIQMMQGGRRGNMGGMHGRGGLGGMGFGRGGFGGMFGRGRGGFGGMGYGGGGRRY